MSKQIEQVVQEIIQLIQDYPKDDSFDARGASRKRLCWIHYLIKMGERMSVPPQEIIKSKPHTFGPGCDFNLVKFPDWITEVNKSAVRSLLCCALCKSLPYIMKQCRNCGYVYCWSCFKYLANLYVFHKKIIRPDKPILCPFVCLNETCWMWQDISPPMIVDPSADKIQLFIQMVYACNQVGCLFRAKWQVMVEHVKYHQDRSETNFRIPDGSLPSTIYRSLYHMNHMNDGDVYRSLSLPNEVQVRNVSCIKVEDVEVIELSQDDDNSIELMVDESKPNEDVTLQKPVIGPLIQKNAAKNVNINKKNPRLSAKTNKLRGFHVNNSIIKVPTVPTKNSKNAICKPRQKQFGSQSSKSYELKSKKKLRIGNSDISSVAARDITGLRAILANTIDWSKYFGRAMAIKNIEEKGKALKTLQNLAGPKVKVNRQEFSKAKSHIESMKKFCPPLYIERDDTPAWSMVMNSVEFIRKNGLKVIALDIIGHTLRIGCHNFGVPCSIGMMNTEGIALCDLIRWPKDLLLDSDNEKILTGLKFDHIKYGQNFTLTRMRVVELLLDADLIVLHGQASVIQKLNFTCEDYNLIRNKIRDIGAYYNCHKEYSTLSLQFATYLIFGESIQGMRKHYAIHNAYFILCLYLADRKRIEKTYEQARSNVYSENGWPVVRYPLNSQICGLLKRHMEAFGDWPEEIKKSPFGEKVFKHNWNQYVEPSKDLYPPYTNPRNLYERFFSSSPGQKSKRPSTQ
ncbi:uncharacterized protein LOC141858776 [Brevipalpus obovatus]|uniref:uncharacterized protein LOC141858776 n=1 Tax=Brevipalpus obovatus TaxID=246614 RepID=UPI003D9EDA20